MAAPAGNENPFTDVIDERFFLELSLHQLERLPEAQMDDRVQRLALDFFPGEPGVVLQQNRFTGERITKSDAAFLDLELFRAGHRDAKPHRDIVRDMVAPD